MADARAPYRRVRVARIGRGAAGSADDVAATEEPLEVRLHGRSFAVIMRTPGADRELAAGFLLSESVIRSHDDLGAVEHCRHPDHPEVHNIVDVYLAGEAAARMDARLEQRRNIVTSSSCGLCGRVTIDSLRVGAAPLAGDRPHGLGGGRRAAGAASANGRPSSTRPAACTARALHARRRVRGLCGRCGPAQRGRQGHRRATPRRSRAADRARAGRRADACSFEDRPEGVARRRGDRVRGLAPSSLAIELAEEAGITLLGFVRDGGFNLYTHPARILGV